MKKLFALLTALSLVIPYAYAEDVHVDTFKGLARNPTPAKIADGAHTRFDNVVIDDGNIRVAKGRQRLNSTAHSDTVVNGFFYYRNAAGTTEKLIVAESDELVTYDLDGTNRTSIVSGLTNSSWDAVQIADTIYFTNETNGLYKWTGTGSVTAVTGVSTPSSVNFSAGTNAGGLTPGHPIVVAASLTSDATCAKGRPDTGQCQTGLICTLLTGADTGGENVSSDSGTLEVAGTDSTYNYKVTYFSSIFGIESESSSSDSATLSGDDRFTWNGTDCQPCDTGNTSSCSETCCTGIQYTTHGSDTSTTGSLGGTPPSPFNTYRVYRTPVGGGENFFLVGEKPSGTFNDGTPDVALGPTLDTTIDTIDPPSFKFIENYKGTVFVAETNNVRFSRLPVGFATDADKYWLETDKLIVGSEKEKVSGLHKTSNSLLIFTNESVQELTGFGTTSFRLQTIVNGVGTISDKSIVTDTNGDIIFFAGTSGVYKLKIGEQQTDTLTGNLVGRQSAQLTKISSPDLDDIFSASDSEISLSVSDYSTANAYYDSTEDRYFLYIGTDAFIFDAASATWSHISGVQTTASLYIKKSTTSGQAYLLDSLGFMYKNWIGYTTGVPSGTVTGNPTSSTGTTLVDSIATFYTTGSGLTGQWVVKDSAGVLEYRKISSNTATELTVSSAWTANPLTTDTYYVGYIIPDIMTKQYNFAKAPNEVQVQYFNLVHNKSGSTQNLSLKSFREKKTTAESTFTIDLSQRYVDKYAANLRSPWVQWQLRTFVYNVSDTTDPPLDIENYTIEVFDKGRN